MATDLNEIGQRIWEEVFGRPPRYSYFQKGNGPMFSWLTEPVEGKYASMVHAPRGPGARTNSARMWKMEERLTAIHDRRKDAKARATRLYRAYYEHGCTITELIDGSYLDKTKAPSV